MAMSFCGKRIILTRNSLFKTLKRKNGYIILLPEIGEDLPDKDPLLKQDGLPQFNTFTIERSLSAIGKQTVLYEQGIKRIEDDLSSSEKVDIVNQLINPLEELNVPIDTTWGVAKTLFFGNQSLMPTKYYHNIHARMISARFLRYTSMPIFKACKEALKDENLNLTVEQRRIIEKYEFEGRMNGLELSESDLNRYRNLSISTSKKVKQMGEQLEIASTLYKNTISQPELMKDFPESFLRETAVDSNKFQEGPWKLTFDSKIVSQFLEHCPDRDLRYKVWFENLARCSMHGEDCLRTSSTLEEIRYNRITQAKLLGFKSYSDMSMETKVAGSLNNVYNVMDSLLETARPVQEKEIEELTKFAHARGFNGMLLQWDIDYWIRQQRRSVYNMKSEILREYFPLPQVLNGLFNLIEKLFNVKIVEGKKTDVWHSDVKFYDVIDLNESTDEPIAHFYLDPYARTKNKMSLLRETGWMVALRHKSARMQKKPLASLIFNFNPPNGDIPSLLTVKDISDLFYKVGNTLQHVLTRVEYSEVAGSTNVEWDAVGISGHFMTNWLYEPTIIKEIAQHYETKETLPDETIQNLKNIRSHMAGYKLCKDVFYARFDLELHEKDDFWVHIMRALYTKHFVMPKNKNESFVTSWIGIFGGDMQAAWYSNLWSEMLAADIYSAFQENPVGDHKQEKEIGGRFRDTFLSLGGSVPAGEVFRRFRGRDPSFKALLKNLKLEENETRAIE